MLGNDSARAFSFLYQGLFVGVLRHIVLRIYRGYRLSWFVPYSWSPCNIEAAGTYQSPSSFSYYRFYNPHLHLMVSEPQLQEISVFHPSPASVTTSS
jgi:hypothetical protein